MITRRSHTDAWMAAEGEKAIKDFLQKQKDGKRACLPVQIRTLIRNVQPFVPRAATTNRTLALECLKSSLQNHMCRYHQARSKRQGAIDGKHSRGVMGEYQVTGVPHKRTIMKAGSDVGPQEGYLSCGCAEDDVLFEFFFWKTWVVTSPTTGITEGWLDQGLDPRTRVFVVSAFKTATRLTLDDLYTKGLDKDTYRKLLLMTQIARLTRELDDLSAADGA
jgi:hypothetical protein